jgi:hypothetical protein
MKAIKVLLLVPLALGACGPLAGTGTGGASVTGAEFVDPAVRAAQEAACAAAVAAQLGVTAGAVRVQRTSSDPENLSIVDATVGAATGYCRVTLDADVVELVI